MKLHIIYLIMCSVITDKAPKLYSRESKRICTIQIKYSWRTQLGLHVYYDTVIFWCLSLGKPDLNNRRNSTSSKYSPLPMASSYMTHSLMSRENAGQESHQRDKKYTWPKLTWFSSFVWCNYHCLCYRNENNMNKILYM